MVLKTSNFAVTGVNVTFRLQTCRRANHTSTAKHESMGTLSHYIKISRGEIKAINFAFPGRF